MNTALLIRKAKQIKGSIEKDIVRMRTFLAKCPDGSLTVANRGKGFEYRIRTSRSDGADSSSRKKTTSKYVNSSMKDIARKLALKKFYSLRIKDYEEMLKGLDSIIKTSGEEKQAEKYLESKGIYELIGDLIVDNNSLALEKFKKYKTDENYRPEGRTVNTRWGFKVRSKSERSIANMLMAAGLLFVYEPRIVINGYEFHPDFLIIHPVTLEIIYWEHSGRLDDKQYRADNLWKLDQYIEDGYIPDVNLILTWETSDNPIDEAIIQMKIEDILQ